MVALAHNGRISEIADYENKTLLWLGVFFIPNNFIISCYVQAKEKSK